MALLEVLIKNAMRATVKAIPIAGPPLEQLTFGVQDDRKKKECEVLLREIHDAVCRSQPTIQNAEATNTLEPLPLVLATSSEGPAALAERLARSTTVDVKALARVVANSERMHGLEANDAHVLQGLKLLTENLQAANAAVMERLKAEHDARMAKVDELCARLEEGARDRPSSQARSDWLTALIDALEESGAFKAIGGYGSTLLRGAALYDRGSSLRLVVDAQQLYEYIFGLEPAHGRPETGYVLGEWPGQIFLLPDDYSEIHRLFAWIETGLADYAGVRSQLAAPQLESSPGSSARLLHAASRRRLTRLRQMIVDGRFVHWWQPVDSQAFNELRERAFDVLGTTRPKEPSPAQAERASRADRIDAAKLATIAMYVPQHEAARAFPATYMTRNARMVAAAKSVDLDLDVFAAPGECFVTTYLRRSGYPRGRDRFLNTLESASGLSGWCREVADALRHLTAESSKTLLVEIQKRRRSLTDLQSIMIDKLWPELTRMQDAELSVLAEDDEKAFDDVYVEVIGTLNDIRAYLANPSRNSA